MNGKRETKLKDIEVRIIAELMKNSRRSDRELAQAVGVSQPTVSRTIKKLEKEGMIKEYTIIPDFRRLGYQIMGVSFFKTGETLKKNEEVKLRKAVVELEKKQPYASLIAVNGSGIGKDRMFVTLYKNYTAYADALRLTRNLPHVYAESLESFLVDLNDEDNYRLLTMEQVARHIQSSKKVLEEESAEKA